MGRLKDTLWEVGLGILRNGEKVWNQCVWRATKGVNYYKKDTNIFDPRKDSPKAVQQEL